MRSRIVHTLLSLFFVVGQASVVFATSGWDRHSVDIESRYRVYGAHGNSVIAQLDDSGNPIDPPLFTLNDNRVYGPPQYIVTTTHIVLRFDSHLPRTLENPERLYFAFRKSDSFMTGPLTDDAFLNSTFGLSDKGKWITPITAADSFGRFVGIVLILITCVVLSPIILLIRWLRRRRAMANATQTAIA